jgi:hypothetical protein
MYVAFKSIILNLNAIIIRLTMMMKYAHLFRGCPFI